MTMRDHHHNPQLHKTGYHSTDSRSYTLGPVKEDYLQGEVIFLLMPGKTPETGKMDFSRIGRVK